MNGTNQARKYEYQADRDASPAYDVEVPRLGGVDALPQPPLVAIAPPNDKPQIRRSQSEYEQWEQPCRHVWRLWQT